MTPGELDAQAAAWEEVARIALGEAHAYRERALTARKEIAAKIAAEEDAQRKKDLAAARRHLGKSAVESTQEERFGPG